MALQFTRKSLELHFRPWFNQFQRDKIIDALFLTRDEASAEIEALVLNDLADVDVDTPELAVGNVLGYEGGDMWGPISLPTLDSSTYTPAGVILANVDTVTPGLALWSRVGNIVTVSGVVQIAPTGAGDTLARITLATPTDQQTLVFTGVEDAAGVASSTGSNGSANVFGPGDIRATSGARTVELRMRVVNTGTEAVRYTYQYYDNEPVPE